MNWGEQLFDSSLVSTAHRLYQKPLCEFTVEDLRLMIGQGIGLHFLVPLAIEKLEKNFLTYGDYHPGDLVRSVLTVEGDFWRTHQELYWRVYELAVALPSIMQDLITTIESFCAESPSVEGGENHSEGRQR